ncbi:MAG: tyrosine-protein phosphatase [Treponema sp.]|nr:tyrosine-protein phosphatase [Treponema sp.]
MPEVKNTERPSLSINFSLKEFKDSDIRQIKFTSISISGCDIPEKEEIQSGLIPVKNKSSQKDFFEYRLDFIKEGSHRIVTAKFYDKNLTELSFCRLRAVTSLENKKNSLTLSARSTSFGNVLYGIKDIFKDFSRLEKDGRMDAIRKVIDEDLPPVLFDSKKLIAELSGFSFPWNGNKKDYTLECGSLDFNYFLSDNFSVNLDDPISSELTGLSAAKSVTIPMIAPGNWTLTVRDSSGRLLEKVRDIQIESGKRKKLGLLEHRGIALLIKKSLNIIPSFEGEFSDQKISPKTIELSPLLISDFYKSSFPLSEDLSKKLEKNSEEKDGPASGQAIEPDPEAELLEKESFLLYDFTKTGSLKFKIKKAFEDDLSSKEAGKIFTISKKGLYCLYDQKPENLISLTGEGTKESSIDNLSITQGDLKKCFVDDRENKRFVVLLSEKLYGGPIYSARALFNRGINDHEGDYRGKHYIMSRKEGEEAFWYCSVPYIDLQQTNQSGQPSYNFMVNDIIIAPPAFVEEGYIYQKFWGSMGKDRFLVLIYSSQNEEAIKKRLAQGKKCKSLKDFDLTKEEDQKKLANFRLTAGTKNLYRSYHPYCDDKTNISDTSRKRMEVLAMLCQKAGIKSDINLSDKCPGQATYFMPDFYQKILDEDAVLYMTDCGYEVCYSESNSVKFAGGIKKIVEFINSMEGPYLIHCRIGTDRTGVICAVLSALCGSSIEEIEEDYCASVEMGIYEYRGPGAVRYALQKLLSLDFIDQNIPLQKATEDYFVKAGYLTIDQIKEMQRRLKK